MATHSSVLAWRIPGTGEPGGLPSIGSHRVGHDWSDLAARSNSKTLNRFLMKILVRKMSVPSCLSSTSGRKGPSLYLHSMKNWQVICSLRQTNVKQQWAKIFPRERVHDCVLSSAWFFVTPWTVAHQAPLSMGFSRQEYWSGLSFPPPGDLPSPGTEPMSLAFPALQVDPLSLSHRGSPSIFIQSSIIWALKRKEVVKHSTIWMNLEYIMLRERYQTKKAGLVWFHLYEMFRTSKSTETESRSVVSRVGA